MRIFFIALLICCAKMCIAQEENYLQGDPSRKYNVKKITEYYYSGTDTNSKPKAIKIYIFHNNKEDTVYKIEKDGIKKLYYKDVYNDSGQLAGYDFYYGGGDTVDAKTSFKYDEKGHRIEYDSYSYYQGNKMAVKALYQYNEDGKMNEQDVYSFHGEFSSRILYAYDYRGLKIEETCNNPSDGKLIVKSTYQYDDFGNLTQV